jgi:NAD(P)-dependent dehydrogenase (short-subunit alcohol dehydrogenase family)
MSHYSLNRGVIVERNKGIRVFDGATAIVTGGASGIGRALGEELAKRGCEVVLVDLQIESAGKGVRSFRAVAQMILATIIHSSYKHGKTNQVWRNCHDG